MYHIFIHSSIHGHLGCFQVLYIVNNAAINIGVHISILISVLLSLDKMANSGVAESYDSSVFKFFEASPYCFP